ncbi:TRAP-type C4-dicarboxylate transport system, small permease component [Lunatimonas lonarensis]|uniref:TRAP-type C4-dicarboxylate transport system, small permease component n=1 Tax=Lunatimonas lonarensis TaxID=1232681 RepID=R7ZQN4_9BACT|nr:TRAP transporter small permease [Lunatimonas lonarensis]EON76392.1 TRAP-type C4-dicarboxylate transport system, small permease component [Lunatimonas lonarensis]
MEKAKNAIDRIVSLLLIVIMAVMVFNVTWQVLSRYVVQSPSSYTDELSRYLLIWLGMLGAAYVAGKNEHLAIDIFPQKVHGLAKKRLMVFIHLAIIAFVVPVMIMGGGNLVYITYTLQQKSATLGLPLAFVYLIIPVSGVLVLFYQIVEILKTLRQPITQN